MKTSEKNPSNLFDLYNLARRAFYWTSFEPEKRGAQTIAEHQSLLTDDLASIPEEEHERYIMKFRELFSKWLSASSRCASPMITGPANFPVARNEKARRAEQNAYQVFLDWRKKAKKAILKKIEANKAEDTKQAETWAVVEKDIKSTIATLRGIKSGELRGYRKTLFIANLHNRLLTHANRGNVEVVVKAIELVRNLNKEISVITERHRFFKLDELARAQRTDIEKRSQQQNIEENILPGITLVRNYEIERLQLFFEEKPNEVVRAMLKRSRFNWSYKNMAWQRQMTPNAEYTFKKVVLPELKRLLE